MNLAISDWLRNLEGRRAASILRSVRVTGQRDKHLGPRWEHAELELVAEPSHQWEVVIELPEDLRAELERDNWIREGIFGLLDVLATRLEQPIFNLRVRVVGAKCNFESSRHAFRMAGRDAGEKLIQTAELCF